MHEGHMYYNQRYPGYSTVMFPATMMLHRCHVARSMAILPAGDTLQLLYCLSASRTTTSFCTSAKLHVL
jgi:hypothetical protein